MRWGRQEKARELHEGGSGRPPWKTKGRVSDQATFVASMQENAVVERTRRHGSGRCFSKTEQPRWVVSACCHCADAPRAQRPPDPVPTFRLHEELMAGKRRRPVAQGAVGDQGGAAGSNQLQCCRAAVVSESAVPVAGDPAAAGSH